MMSGKNELMKLEILWARLNTMVDEAATALVRTCFSPVIRDANDYGCAFFDTDYNLLAQSTFGTPGFLGALPLAMKKLGECFPPDTLQPGDVLVTNDPWICTGHLNDITVATPIFVNDALVAYAICTAHEVDIGGRIAIIETKEVYEEGLFIPPLKLYEKGKPNETVFAFLRANIRMADQAIGDVRAQVAANEVMARRLAQLMREYNFSDLRALSKEILTRTEMAVRANIRQLPEGTYRHEAVIDSFDDEPIKIAVAVTLKDGELTIDYDGTTPQISKGVNVCYNYTRSYTMFGAKCIVSPNIPNNEGALRPIRILAPEGSILNCRHPAPVNSRSSIGQFLPEIVFGALSGLIPDRAIAASGSTPIWVQRFSGERHNREKFLLFCVSRGGLGARSTADGVSTLAFPSNTVPTPVEIIEGDGPVIYEKKELRQDSAGAGKYRGGLGQHVQIRVLDSAFGPAGPVLATAKGGRIHLPVPGVAGGHDAPKGALAANGETFDVSGKQMVLKGGDRLELFVPGGGGYGDPYERDLHDVEEDIRNGVVSVEEAKRTYGVVLSEDGSRIDPQATAALRATRQASMP